MTTHTKTKPKQVVYLLGAGATYAEVRYRDAAKINTLMRDIGSLEGVATRILKRCNPSMFAANGNLDIEKAISLLIASGVDGQAGFQVELQKPELVKRILQSSFSELSSKIQQWSFRSPNRLVEHHEMSSRVSIESKRPQCRMTIGIVFDETHPNSRWSFSAYSKEFITALHRLHRDVATVCMAFSIDVEFSDIVVSNNIGTEIERCREIIGKAHQAAEQRLFPSIDDNSVVMSFDFPEEVKIPCEQYLLYFAQFLKDLGVNVETALTHEAGQALFRVTPTDKDQALENIQTALEVYLNLPSNPFTPTSDQSIAVERLEATILRLRSDLKLASAELRADATTIQAQQLIIDLQKGLLSGEVLPSSVKNVTPKPPDPDKFPLLRGTLSVIPIKGKGVEIHLPEILRSLKQLFSRKKV